MRRRNFVALTSGAAGALALRGVPTFAKEPGIRILSHVVTWLLDPRTPGNAWGTVLQHPCRTRDNPLGQPCASPDPSRVVGYDSLDPLIIAEQNRDFLELGIIPLLSWWGPEGSWFERSGDVYLNRYLSVPSPVQVALLYEADGRFVPSSGDKYSADKTYRFDDSAEGVVNREQFIADMFHLQGKYLAAPAHAGRFYPVNGKPLVFLWNSNIFRGRFGEVAKQVRDVIPVYFMGSELNPERTDLALTLSGLDAVSNYGVYDPELVKKFNGVISPGFIGEYLRSMMAWAQWLRDNAPWVEMVMPLMFSFSMQDMGGNPSLACTEDDARMFAFATRSFIELAFASGARVREDLVNFTSWNEFMEGSSAEASREYPWVRNVLYDVFTMAP